MKRENPDDFSMQILPHTERVRRMLAEIAEKEKQRDETLRSIETLCGRGRRRKR